jgi:hypothetical protein
MIEASSKTCQEVLLAKIAKSTLSKHVTIKGGVIIQHISKDVRRATIDFDFDFIKYPLDEDSIRAFLDSLNDIDDEIIVSVVAPIEQLNHQEYHGMRVFIELADAGGATIATKLDIGVHSKLNIKQEDYCFELNCIGESVVLLVNSIEQMFSEKLSSLLRLGRFSTRYKDIFDLYYFISVTGLNKEILMTNINEYIYNVDGMREKSIGDIRVRLTSIFQDRTFLAKADTARNNWLKLPTRDVAEGILLFFDDDIVC